MVKNKKVMHHTIDTHTAILKSLVRIFVALSFCGYNVFGIIYHLSCNPFFEVSKFV